MGPSEQDKIESNHNNLVIACSINMRDRTSKTSLALVISVDSDHVLRVFKINSEKSELVFKKHISIDTGDKVSCLHFFTRAKSILITTKNGNTYALTPDRQQTILKDLNVSTIGGFEVDSEKYFCLGLASGTALIKLQNQIVTNDIVREIKPSDLVL